MDNAWRFLAVPGTTLSFSHPLMTEPSHLATAYLLSCIRLRRVAFMRLRVRRTRLCIGLRLTRNFPVLVTAQLFSTKTSEILTSGSRYFALIASKIEKNRVFCWTIPCSEISFGLTPS